MFTCYPHLRKSHRTRGATALQLITIVKGDTLWDLCQEHLKDPLRWRELSKYNDFTNPHLIYPGEELRIPIAMMKEVKEIVQEELVVAAGRT